MLLIAALAIPISAEYKVVHKPQSSLSIDVNPPIWEVGDTWTYETYIYMAASPNVTDDMVGHINGELLLEVICNTGDTYQLTGEMRPISGIVDIPGNIDMKLTKLSSYISTLEVNKSDLSIINCDFTMKGILLLTLGPITLPIPIQMQYHRYTEFTPIWHFLPFPFYDGKTGIYENSSMHLEIETSMFWGLIPIAELTSDEGWLGGDAPYTCTADTITVPAGTYDVMNISCTIEFGGEGYDYYYSNYAEEVGSIAYGIYNIDYGNGNTSFLIKLELKETTYSP
jgi:hypothetical protein